MNLPTLRQLEYIVAVAETGQFVAAARRCAVSQPALSKQVREVEELLGVPLFERTRPRVVLTDAGQEVVPRARELLRQARELVELTQAHAAGPQGTLKLGVIPTIAPYGLPGLLVKLRRRFPEVRFAIHELQTEVLLAELRSGGIDLGLLARAFDDEGLTGPDLVTEPFVLVAPAGHPLGTPEVVHADELVGASLILMQDGHCLRDQAIEVCASAGAAPPASVAAASVATLVRMVEGGLGATLLPASALAAELRPGLGLVARPFEGSPPGRTLTLQWRSTSPHGAWFMELGALLTEHYLSLNAGMPPISGPEPRVRAVGGKDGGC
ncbi:MAG: LysR family transcriptional regulator [Alphaproteobacteria bacterium]|nr:LysR family transcriptional regulator [Alphaproteobacteria bacterium]